MAILGCQPSSFSQWQMLSRQYPVVTVPYHGHCFLLSPSSLSPLEVLLRLAVGSPRGSETCFLRRVTREFPRTPEVCHVPAHTLKLKVYETVTWQKAHPST